MHRAAVFIMAKTPQPGEVKTRLCPPLTGVEAAELYRCFLLDKIEQVRSLKEAIPAVAYAPAEGRTVFESLAPGFALIPQRGPDLGARLANGFADFLTNGCDAALAIDSDTPTLPVEFLEQALDLIWTPSVDVVLGPTEDGGYYLIGLRALHRLLFEDISWSTSRVLPETIKRAEASGLRIARLPAWYDVDIPGDLEHLKRALAVTGGIEPFHTRRFFNALRVGDHLLERLGGGA
ncbi:MAG: TIGR04282 family arsenosugar biosynthesis glycosyltransferase [Candidatus Rokubacteria bacterium]|nr:TIGR04282 family arsenosugar biosynthesis glycosyltransferase [Candidatus Rokubacteria bacterium]